MLTNRCKVHKTSCISYFKEKDISGPLVLSLFPRISQLISLFRFPVIVENPLVLPWHQSIRFIILFAVLTRYWHTPRLRTHPVRCQLRVPKVDQEVVPVVGNATVLCFSFSSFPFSKNWYLRGRVGVGAHEIFKRRGTVKRSNP